MADNNNSSKQLVNKIRAEYSELSFSAKFLEKLVGNKTEFEMAYKLLKECEAENGSCD